MLRPANSSETAGHCLPVAVRKFEDACAEHPEKQRYLLIALEKTKRKTLMRAFKPYSYNRLTTSYCVCAPYPRMPSANPHAVSSFWISEMFTPASVTVAIWYYNLRQHPHKMLW